MKKDSKKLSNIARDSTKHADTKPLVLHDVSMLM